MNKRKLLTGPYLVWAIAFILIPLAVILYYGLTNSDGHFTFENILAIGTVENFKALCLSLLLSLISTLICLILAYPLAMMLSNMKVSQTSFMVLIFILPMWMNFLLRTMAWQTLLEKNGVINQILSFFHLPSIQIINTPGAIILGMVYNFLPFMVLPLYNVLSKIDRDIILAARDLGATSVYTFRKIIFPLSLQRHYHGLCPCPDDFRHLGPPGRKQDPPHRKCHRPPVPAGKQLACRQRSFSGAYGLYPDQYVPYREIR